jgi:isoquinoline 1-oxidoreductase alpha subunit
MASFTPNGKPVAADADPQTRLLWIIRDPIGLTGTKYGCGAGLCGACTVHVDGRALRSCQMPIAAVEGAKVVAIEERSPNGSHPLQKAWIAEQVPQCGSCQSGQIMKAAELLANNPKPSRDQIIAHMDGDVTLKDGAVGQSNVSDYTVMRMSDMPDELNIAFIDSDAPATRLGEVGTPFVMPAIANAFYRLTGKRLYHMPFRPERVRATLKA